MTTSEIPQAVAQRPADPEGMTRAAAGGLSKALEVQVWSSHDNDAVDGCIDRYAP